MSLECDVAVIGGGVAGMLVTRKLLQKGYGCCLIEKDAFLGSQSGHSHGYLHRGYIYLGAERRLAQELSDACDIWMHILAELGSSHMLEIAAPSFVGFADAEAAAYAEQKWTAAGLSGARRVDAGELPLTLRDGPLHVAFATDEKALDFSIVASALRVSLRDSGLVNGTVSKLSVRGDGSCDYATVHLKDSSVVQIRAKYFILAAGLGNDTILANTLGKFKAAPNVRTSYMLVARGQNLEGFNAILPEHEFHGLFLVSRERDDGVIWLISNHLSYGGVCDTRGVACRTWMKGMLRVLDKVFPQLGYRKDVEWGLYEAPKAEFRSDPTFLPEGCVCESFGLRNAVATWPTKLTLTPLILEHISELVRGRVEPTGRVSFEGTTGLAVAAETWTGVQLMPLEDLCESIDVRATITAPS